MPVCVECAGYKPQVPDIPCDQQQTAQLDSETHTVPPVNHGTGSAVQSAGAVATDTIPSTGGNITSVNGELIFCSTFADLWLVSNK